MNIVLIGYRCCGKTSIGKIIAERLDKKFVDTDELIIEKAGCSIGRIVSNHGWQSFRNIEAEIVKEVSALDNLVIATGGGAVIQEDNISNLKRNGFVVWLYADIDIIRKRLIEDTVSDENRPSLTGDDPSDEIKAVLEEREPLYKGASDVAIDTGELNINEVTDVIIEEIKNRGQKSEV